MILRSAKYLRNHFYEVRRCGCGRGIFRMRGTRKPKCFTCKLARVRRDNVTRSERRRMNIERIVNG